MVTKTELKQKVIDALSIPWGGIKLACDGREVTLQVKPFGVLRYRVMTYVDGVFKGAWISGDNEHPEQKFLRKKTVRVYSARQIKEFEKKFGKRRAAKYFPNKEAHCFLGDWPSGRSAIIHLLKVCNSVELID